MAAGHLRVLFFRIVWVLGISRPLLCGVLLFSGCGDIYFPKKKAKALESPNSTAPLLVVPKSVKGLRWHSFKSGDKYFYRAEWEGEVISPEESTVVRPQDAGARADADTDILRGSQYLIKVGGKSHALNWGDSVWRFACDRLGRVPVEVERYYQGEMVEAQQLDFICPLDIQVGVEYSEAALRQLLNEIKGGDVYLGEVHLSTAKKLQILVEGPYRFHIQKIVAPLSECTIEIAMGPTLSSQMQLLSKWHSWRRTYLAHVDSEATKAELIHPQPWWETVVKGVLPQVSALPVVDLIVYSLDGKLKLTSVGLNGVPAVAAAEMFRVHNERLKTPVEPPPPRPSEFDDRWEEYSVRVFNPNSRTHGTESRHRCVPFTKDPANNQNHGTRGNSGRGGGVPGVMGGVGIPPISLVLEVHRFEEGSEVRLVQSPASGGPPSEPGLGQPGSQGGLGAQKNCDGSARYPQGPAGESGPKGPSAEYGYSSKCAMMSVTTPSNFKVQFDFASCPGGDASYQQVSNLEVVSDFKFIHNRNHRDFQQQSSTPNEGTSSSKSEDPGSIHSVSPSNSQYRGEFY